MGKLFKKNILIISLLFMVAFFVSCNNEEKITVEMPYVASLEANIDKTMHDLLGSYTKLDYTYANSVVSISMYENQIAKVLEDVIKQNDKMVIDFTMNGNGNVKINEDYTLVEISYNPNVDEKDIDIKATEFLSNAVLYQCFSGVPAEDFEVTVTYKAMTSNATVNEFYFDLESFSKR